MEYLLTFIEGIASFISPCLLPMIPIYISYFVGKDEKKTNKAVINSIGFVCGFSIVFLVLSIFASSFGVFVSEYIKYIKKRFGLDSYSSMLSDSSLIFMVTGFIGKFPHSLILLYHLNSVVLQVLHIFLPLPAVLCGFHFQ